jgi:hypothetical protein
MALILRRFGWGGCHSSGVILINILAISDKCKNKISKIKITSQKSKLEIRSNIYLLLKEKKHFCIFIYHFDF